MSSDQCSIPSNPDVSGIGVRYAIYIQNILCFLPVIINLVDGGKISSDNLKGIQDQSFGTFAIAFSILITTIILAKGAGGNQGITNYHASIVLDLSWMNSTGIWIWLILFVYRLSKPRGGAPVPATWRAWYNLLLRRRRVESAKEGRDGIIHRQVRRVFRTIQHIPSIPRPSSAPIFRIVRYGWNNIILRIINYGRWLLKPLTNIFRRTWSAATKYPFLTLGSFHLSLMAAVGVWLWSDPSHFGRHVDCNPTIEVIDRPTQLLSRPLKIASLAFYSLFLAPVLNLCLPFLFFLALHISYNWLREQWEKAKVPFPRDTEAAQGSDITLNVSSCQKDVKGANNNYGRSSDSRPHTAFLVVGLLCLLAINILFILDIELTLRRNRSNQTGGDNDWGFGQVLALLLLIFPLRDAWTALQGIGKERRDSKEQRQKQLEVFFRTICEATPAHEELERLLEQDGVTSETQIKGNEKVSFNSFLSMAAYYGKADLVKCLRQGREKQRGKIAFSNHLQRTH
jgi:hypothetical protein